MPNALTELPARLRNKAVLMQIGQDILMNVNYSKTSTTSLAARRKHNLALYRGVNLDPTSDDPKDKRPRYSVQVMKSRIKQRAANFAANVTQADPIFEVFGLDRQSKINAQESVLGYSLNNIRIESRVRTAGLKAMVRHSAMIRVGHFNFPKGYDGASHSGAFCGPVWDIIDPDDCMVWPNIPRPIEESVTHGHRFEMADFTIRQKIANGDYLPDRIAGLFSGGLDEKPVIDGELQDGVTGAGDSSTSHAWDVLHRHITNQKTGEEMWLRVVVDVMGRVLLCKEWPHPVSWYVLMQDDDESKGIWSETGTASDMAGWQNVINAVVNEVVFNAMRQSRSPVLIEKGMLSTDMDGYGDKQFIEVKNLSKAMPMPVQNAVEELMNCIQLCMQFVDMGANSSQAIMGGDTAGPANTATEEQIKYQGFQLATSDDVMMYGEALIKCARLSLYWITYYWEEWSKCYADEVEKLGLKVEDLKAKSIITLNGQVPNQLPQQQVQTAQTALMLLSQAIADQPEFQGIKVKLVKTIIENMPLKGKEELMPMIEMMEQEADEAMAMQKMMKMLQGVVPPELLQAMMAGGGMPGQAPQGQPPMALPAQGIQ